MTLDRVSADGLNGKGSADMAGKCRVEKVYRDFPPADRMPESLTTLNWTFDNAGGKNPEFIVVLEFTGNDTLRR
jgi:hypothetical protein